MKKYIENLFKELPYCVKISSIKFNYDGYKLFESSVNHLVVSSKPLHERGFISTIYGVPLIINETQKDFMIVEYTTDK